MADIPTTSWDETNPSGTQAANLGDDRIRELKTQLREVIGVDHKMESSGNAANWGYHSQMTLIEQADLGTGATGKCLLGAQTDTTPELCFTDEADNDVKITKDGALAVLGSEGWRSGDLLLSSSTATPTGWTDVSTTYDNKFIRIGDDTPLTTVGGSDTHSHDAGTYAGPSHNHSVSEDGWGHQTTSYTTGKLQTSDGAAGGYSNLCADNGINTGAGGTGSVTGASADASTLPAYIQTRLYKKD